MAFEMDWKLARSDWKTFQDGALDHFLRQKNAQWASPGWGPLLAAMYEQTERAMAKVPEGNTVEWSQIKSKFGTLRAYWQMETPRALAQKGLEKEWDEVQKSYTDDELFAELDARGFAHSKIVETGKKRNIAGGRLMAAIDEADALSGMLCEFCGAPGKTGGKGWIVTLCPECKEAKISWETGSNLVEKKGPVLLGRMFFKTGVIESGMFKAAYKRANKIGRIETFFEKEEGVSQFDKEWKTWAQRFEARAKRVFGKADLNGDMGRGIRLIHFPWSVAVKKLLVDAGADPFVRCDLGRDALGWAQALDETVRGQSFNMDGGRGAGSGSHPLRSMIEESVLNKELAQSGKARAKSGAL